MKHRKPSAWIVLVIMILPLFADWFELDAAPAANQCSVVSTFEFEGVQVEVRWLQDTQTFLTSLSGEGHEMSQVRIIEQYNEGQTRRDVLASCAPLMLSHQYDKVVILEFTKAGKKHYALLDHTP